MTDILLSVALLHLGVLLAVAGVSKTVASSTFVETLNGHGLLPRQSAKIAARSIITLELSFGLWLISGVAYRLAAAAAAALLASFVFYRVVLRAFGPEGASCGCLGDSGAADTTGVVLNLGLAVAVAVLGSGSNRYSLDVALSLAAVGIGAVLVLIARNKRISVALRPSES